MNTEFNPILIFLILTGLLSIPNCVCQIDEQYAACRRPFGCGDIGPIIYPFWGDILPEYCGYPGFQITCRDDILRLNISSVSYRVLNIDYLEQSIRLSRDDLSDTLCPRFLFNTTLEFGLFDFAPNYQNVTLFYGCGPDPPPAIRPAVPNQFSCDVNGSNTRSYYFTGEAPRLGNNHIGACRGSIVVPVSRTAAEALGSPGSDPRGALQQALAEGFSLRWSAENDYCNRCAQSGGECGGNLETRSFACYCIDGPRQFRCNDTRSGKGNNISNLGMNIGLPIGGAVLAGVGLGWLIYCYCRKRRTQHHQRLGDSQSTQTVSKETSSPPSRNPLFTPSSTDYVISFTTSNSDLGRGSTYFGAHVFNYDELEEATDGFDRSRILGDGGFGTVYYGILSDGRIVAVKRLYENNFKRVVQFMNEVEILTRLRHKNLVTLYGCTSKRSRELLLVYEYIPNGTVADHLHGGRAKSGLLSWPIRLNIAVETAEALAYLHKSDIIHRDVKTNNILLDNDFHVKVADFGLSRLFPNDVTHVSTAPQGTPGYVDPEYYQCYQLTEKSDVYSFGVVLIELISSLQAVDTNRHRNDINLSSMAVNKIQNRALGELVDPSIGFETNGTVRRMVTLVAELAFRCLQHERDMRPSMEQLLEGLRGIQNEELMSDLKVEMVDRLLVDDNTGPLKGSVAPLSPDSAATEKWTSGSTANSSW